MIALRLGENACREHALTVKMAWSAYEPPLSSFPILCRGRVRPRG